MTDVSISSIMSARAAILERNAALRNIVQRDPNRLDGSRDVVKPTSSFASMLETALQKVNANLEQEDAATEAYERGETTDIATVAIMQARASVSFEATMQVRNKLLSAYKDIMSMPV